MAKTPAQAKKNRTTSPARSPAPEKTSPEPDPVLIQPGSGKRFLLGCAFPFFFLLLLLILAALPAVWCLLQAKAPDRIPVLLDSAVNRIRFHSAAFYRLTEKGCELAGGARRTLLERAEDHADFRIEIPEPDGSRTTWLIRSDSASRILPGLPPEPVFFADRGAFLRSLRTDGEYTDSHPLPSRSVYRAGSPVRIRRCPAENSTWFFDCVYTCDGGSPADGETLRPWTGRHLAGLEKGMVRDLYPVLHLAGIPVEEEFFSASCYLRGEDALASISPEERMFYLYAFSPNGERLRAAVVSGSHGTIRDLIRRKNAVLLREGVPLFSGSLIRMAVRRSDLALVSRLVREEDALQEMKEESARKPFTTLHEAALQPDPRILAKIIPLYSETAIPEPRSGATPFHTAVMAGNAENVLLFLRRNDRDLRSVLPDGSGVLHLAVHALSPDIVELLLSHGADKACRNRRGETPLELLKRKIRTEHLENDPAAERIRILLEE